MCGCAEKEEAECACAVSLGIPGMRTGLSLSVNVCIPSTPGIQSDAAQHKAAT